MRGHFIDDMIDVYLPRLAGEPHQKTTCCAPSHALHKQTAHRRKQAILSLLKLLAKGTPLEQQIVWRWLLDIRRLLEYLPDDEYMVAWLSTVKHIIKDKSCAKEDLDMPEGQLDHAAYVIPLARHFLTHIRAAHNLRTHKKN